MLVHYGKNLSICIFQDICQTIPDMYFMYHSKSVDIVLNILHILVIDIVPIGICDNCQSPDSGTQGVTSQLIKGHCL